MKTECCVLGCQSSRYIVPYHKFPKNLEQFLAWKAAVYSDKIKGLTESELRNRMVCHRHFKDDDYFVSSKIRKLKPGAIPSVALPCDTATDTAISTPAVKVQVYLNDQPSCSYYVEVETTSSEANTAVRSVAMEVEVSGSRTPRQNTKSRLCLLGNLLKAGNLPPRKAKLYRFARLLCRKQAYANKNLRTVKQRLREAQKFFRTKSVKSMISTLSSAEQAFIEMQLKTSKHAPRGRRYSMKAKIRCMSIYQQSRRAYKLLESTFNLPSGEVLRELQRRMVLRPGLNGNMMDHLAKKAQSMSKLNKICCLMWDKVYLQPHIDVSPTLQRIVGFADHGKVRRSKFADVALVFMLRGIKTGWKLPLAFYFSDSETTSADLISCIREVTEAVVNSGLRIAAYVCDHSSSNVKAVNHLVSETANDASPAEKLSGNIIHLYNQTIVAVYDPPHLIKGVRNNLFTKDLEYTPGDDVKKYLSWNIIRLAFDIDNVDPPRRQMRKITKEHMRCYNIKEMQLKHAVQVLSGRMSAHIEFYSHLVGYVPGSYGPISIPKVEGGAAASLIGFLNNLFDSCNGHTKKPENRYRAAVTRSSAHMSVWTNALRWLERMQFVNPKNKQKDRSNVLRSWITTLKGNNDHKINHMPSFRALLGSTKPPSITHHHICMQDGNVIFRSSGDA